MQVRGCLQITKKSYKINDSRRVNLGLGIDLGPPYEWRSCGEGRAVGVVVDWVVLFDDEDRWLICF